ncbi:MAG: hypothetical protein ACLS7H_07545, partial [Parasutterella sp.]|uniref:hypothetical protein n=1 Tax=Parasutterella sp. TaxID=2049037 RepID=UPI0039956FBE
RKLKNFSEKRRAGNKPHLFFLSEMKELCLEKLRKICLLALSMMYNCASFCFKACCMRHKALERPSVGRAPIKKNFLRDGL